MIKKALVVQIGARMHYAIPHIFNKQGILSKLHTDFYLYPGEVRILKTITNGLPAPIRKMLGRQTIISPRKIVRNRIFGLFYTLKLHFSKTRARQTKNYLWAGRKICESVIKKEKIENFDIFYGFNTDSLEILKECRDKGIFSILEQTIAAKNLHNELLKEEDKIWPMLEPNFSDHYVNEVIDREKQEWYLSNIIVCASNFVKESLINEGVEDRKIHVVPYGVVQPEKFERNKKTGFHVIFVGNFGLRKGGIYFLEAAKLMRNSNVKFTVIGSIGLDSEFIDQYRSFVNFTGSIPRKEVANYYKDADVLCLPSLCEGSATVSYEALSYGVPLITTHNSGTTVVDGETGFIVPIRNTDAIVDKIKLLNNDRELQRKLSENAQKDSLKYTWEKYEERLMAVIKMEYDRN